ncbi:hypothetical protein ACLOJK_038021 [Asimina triloba]
MAVLRAKRGFGMKNLSRQANDEGSLDTCQKGFEENLSLKQVKALGRFFTFCFLWGFFQWFYTAADECGFRQFPTFGLEAHKNMSYLDFSTTYVGVGMICPYIVNISLLVGSILSWGIMWPLIATRKGDWYPASVSSSSLYGLQGYRVFTALAMILGDGLYNFFKTAPPLATVSVSYDDQRRAELFLKDQIPLWLAVGGYIAIAAVSIGTLPQIFPQLKWYYVFVSYIFAPVLAFCNAYGAGLTDWSLASAYDSLQKEMADIIITPVIKQLLPSFTLVSGQEDAVALAKLLKAKFIVPMKNGDLDSKGLLSRIIYAEGTVESFKDLLSRELPDAEAWDLWNEGRSLELVNSAISDTCSTGELLRCVQVGLLCVQENSITRPTMLSVVSMLGNETAMPPPKKPAYSSKKFFFDPDSSTSGAASRSTNEITVTELKAR